MAKPRNQTVDYLQYLALRLVHAFFHIFDIRTNYRTARLIGDVLFLVDRRHRRIAIGHLRRSFPDWPEDRYRQVARETMRNLVYLGLEVLFTGRMISPVTWRKHIRLHNVGEAIRLLVQHDRPTLWLTGHLGNWEVMGYTMAMLGFPVTAVARRLDNPYLNEFVLGMRERTGLSIVDKKGAATALTDVLDRNGAVAFVADQDAGRKGLFVDFFGRPASTYKSIALLAMQYEAPVLVGSALRRGGAFEFDLRVERAIYPSDWADKEDPVRWITQEYTRALEHAVRRDPRQYLWLHRRWKHRPKGEPRPDDGIA